MDGLVVNGGGNVLSRDDRTQKISCAVFLAASFHRLRAIKPCRRCERTSQGFHFSETEFSVRVIAEHKVSIAQVKPDQCIFAVAWQKLFKGLFARRKVS